MDLLGVTTMHTTTRQPRTKRATRSATLSLSTISVCLLFSCFLALSPASAADSIAVGSGRFVFSDPSGNTDKPITVWYHSPRRLNANTPVVFVMHGVKRNGREYRDSWAQYAERRRFLLLVPEFSKKYYPGSRQYNLGNMFSSSGEAIDRSKWTYTAIEHVFDHVKTITRLETNTYSIYGHSAGAQFVHRMMLFLPAARIGTAVSANAGWYTMPTNRWAYPYGLKKSGISLDRLKDAFKQNLIILLGDKDTNEKDKYLRRTPEAMAQGKHRFERGKAFFETARREAARLETPFKWKVRVVRGVGHSNSKMARAAASLLISRKPSPQRTSVPSD